MHYKLNLTAIFIFMFSLNIFAQIPVRNLDNNQFVGLPVVQKDLEVSGSQYYQEEFFDAKISVINNEVVEVRYNVVRDEMEFKREEKVFQMYKTDNLVVTFLNINKVFKIVEYQLRDQTITGFLISKSENDKVNFFVKEVITLVPFKAAANSYGSDAPAHYRKDRNIFFIEMNNKITEMPNKKKNLLKLFPNDTTKIEEFLKANKTDFDKEDSVLMLVNFLNTL